MRYSQHITNRLTLKLNTDQSSSISQHIAEFDKVFRACQITAEISNQVPNLFNMGVFKAIDPDRLALPNPRPQPKPNLHNKWASLLPDELPIPITSGLHSAFVMRNIAGIKGSKKIPRPVLHLKQKPYPNLLKRMHTAGML